MKSFLQCMKKDLLEYLRTKKLLITISFLVIFGMFVLLASAVFPDVFEELMQYADFLADNITLQSFIDAFFPRTVSGSLGVYASDISMFYSLMILFMTFNLFPADIRSGRMILPLCSGHHRNQMLIAKEIVYSILFALPIWGCIIVFYAIARSILIVDFSWADAFCLAFVCAFNALLISSMTITMSVVFKKKIITLVTVILSVVVAPDMIPFFSFGKYLPEYTIYYAKNALTSFQSVLIPYAITIIFVLGLNLLAVLRRFSVDVDERR